MTLTASLLVFLVLSFVSTTTLALQFRIFGASVATKPKIPQQQQEIVNERMDSTTTTTTSRYYDNKKTKKEEQQPRTTTPSPSGGVRPSSLFYDNNPPKKKNKNKPIVVHNVKELRQEVIENGIPLKELEFDWSESQSSMNATTATPEQLSHHPVLQLLAERYRTNSTPGARDDEHHVALAIEGGGMRGAVSAGMAAAICSLGLLDTIDSIYGSSAGCIVGAYMVSRQMCVDVYTQVLPAAGPMFACKNRVIRNVASGYVQDVFRRYVKEPVKLVTTSSTIQKLAKKKKKNKKNNSKKKKQQQRLLLREQAMMNDTTTRRSTTEAANAVLPMNLDGTFNTTLLQGNNNNNNETTTTNTASSTTSSTTTPTKSSSSSFSFSPGMNISFVIDGIMNGLRPFDMEAFRSNNMHQPLYAISSTYRNDGAFETVAFNAQEGDFWDILVEDDNKEEEGSTTNDDGSDDATQTRKRKKLRRRRRRLQVLQQAIKKIIYFLTQPILWRRRRAEALNVLNKTLLVRQETACPDNSGKKGFYACLESSMNVPGAAGPPVQLLRSRDRKPSEESSISEYWLHHNINVGPVDPSLVYNCFDAFCYEPIPYRSAVESGKATHVLALRSRPDGCSMDMEPKTYESVVAPNYFRKHQLPQVANFFEQQGSQYRYLEDVLTLDEGLVQGCTEQKAISIPPTELLTGVPTKTKTKRNTKVEDWKTAFLLPIVCKANTHELPSLTQDKKEVIEAVRDGFVAAFTVLAPLVLSSSSKEDGTSRLPDARTIAELLIPMDDYLMDEEDILQYDILNTPVPIKGELIPQDQKNSSSRQRQQQQRMSKRKRIRAWMMKQRRPRQQQQQERNTGIEENDASTTTATTSSSSTAPSSEAEAILEALPGFQNGRLHHLAGPLLSSTSSSNS